MVQGWIKNSCCGFLVCLFKVHTFIKIKIKITWYTDSHICTHGKYCGQKHVCSIPVHSSPFLSWTVGQCMCCLPINCTEFITLCMLLQIADVAVVQLFQTVLNAMILVYTKLNADWKESPTFNGDTLRCLLPSCIRDFHGYSFTFIALLSTISSLYVFKLIVSPPCDPAPSVTIVYESWQIRI